MQHFKGGQTAVSGIFSTIAANTPPSDLKDPFYEGSVQKLFEMPNDHSLMITQTTERGSVFDVGALFEIPGQDVNRAVFRHVLYSRMGDTSIWEAVTQAVKSDASLDSSYREMLLDGVLEEFTSMGALTHHVGMLDNITGEMFAGGLPENPSAYNVVQRFKILKPTRMQMPDGTSVFDYSGYTRKDGFVVPLEFIVRFGITSASSVYRKYQQLDAASKTKFEAELGATKPLEAWQYLEKPITDFTTKFEPTDRMLSKQEALLTSSLSGRLFHKGTKMAVLGAWAVRQMIAPLGLKMWDIKWEFALDQSDLIYVDTIDPDSFRATLEIEFENQNFVVHCNKQAMRDYFQLLHGDWIDAINQSKAQSELEGVAFTEILAAGQKSGKYAETPSVQQEFIKLQELKMTTICDFLLCEVDSEQATKQLREVGLQELNFYKAAGKLKELATINAF